MTKNKSSSYLIRWQLIIVLLVTCIFFADSCIDRFTPEILNYNNMLFIESYLTNDPNDIPFVKISAAISLEDEKDINTVPGLSDQRFSFLFEDGKYKGYYYGSEILYPEGLAEVSIENKAGTVWTFTESYPGTGVYFDNTGLFAGIQGESYKINIRTQSGDTFESGFEDMNYASPIDSISYEIRNDVINDFGESSFGVRFDVSSTGASDENGYFRWSLTETYEYEAQVEAHFLSLGGQKKRDFSNSDIWYCYKTNFLPGVYVGNSSHYVENRLSNVPLNFVSQHGYQLSRRYSLSVKQLAITGTAYRFWNDVSLTTSGTEGLFASQPYTLEGNIKCTSDPEKKIIGIFEVAAISEARIFVDRPEEFDVLIDNCPLDTLYTYDDWLSVDSGDYLTYVEGLNVFITAPKICYDCRVRGGTTIVPEFWVIRNEEDE